jgi:hypothetical protein
VRAALVQTEDLLNEPTAALPKNATEAQLEAATMPVIGSANIAFLDRNSTDGPNARTVKVESTFWISTVVYTVDVKTKFTARTTGPPLVLDALETDKFTKDTVPTFVFPTNMDVEVGKYSVEATQIQYSQTVNLIFNGLVWPHISVATLISVRPVLIKNAERLPPKPRL